MNTIRKDISENKIKNLYLLYGPEEYLKDYCTNLLRDAVCTDGANDINMLRIAHEKPEQPTVEEFINSYPFFGERKVLILKDTGIVKKANESDKKFWGELVKNIPDYAVIVFNETEIDKRSVIYKTASSQYYAAEFVYKKKNELIHWCQNILKKDAKTMDEKDIEYLIDSCDDGMMNIKKELDKLIMYKRKNNHITRADIDCLVPKSVENRVFEMSEDMILKKTADALKKLDNLKVLGSEPIAIISAVFAKFSAYRKIKLLSDRSIREIASITGQRDYFVKNDMQKLKNVSLKYINNVIYNCQRADYRIKSGKGAPWSELEMLVMTIFGETEV